MSGRLDGVKTPDGRYLVIRDRLWRASDPRLPATQREAWTARLMSARRAVGIARRRGDVEATRRARRLVDRAKRALGERGPVWWTDGAPDYNRRLVRNTPCAEWFEQMQQDATAVLTLLSTRPSGSSICPSEAARVAAPQSWRSRLNGIREAARHLARLGAIVITQRGRAIDPDTPIKGPIRYSSQHRRTKKEPRVQRPGAHVLPLTRN